MVGDGRPAGYLVRLLHLLPGRWLGGIGRDRERPTNTGNYREHDFAHEMSATVRSGKGECQAIHRFDPVNRRDRPQLAYGGRGRK